MQERRDEDTPDAPVPTEVQRTLGHYLYKQTEGPLAQGVRQVTAPRANQDLCTACRRIWNNSSDLGPKLAKNEQGPFFMHLSLAQLVLSAETCRLCAAIVESVPSRDLEPNKARDLPGRYDFAQFMTIDTVYALRFHYTTFLANPDGTEPRISANPPVILTLEKASIDSELSPREINEPMETSSSASISQAKTWIEQCDATHPCRSDRLRGAKPEMPTRVIDVTRFEKDVCLRNGSDIDGFQEYIALSHCWGEVQTLKLSKENLEQFGEQIPWERLPKTFADAVTVTRLLGIQYLWIDSLCIIQDSHTDWEREASMMWRLYTCAFLNLSATASANSEQGLFRSKRPFAREKCMVQVEEKHHHFDAGSYLCYNAAEWEQSVDLAPLNTRAWVLQERVLAPRVLHFAQSQIFWECHGSHESGGFWASEQFPAGLPHGYNRDDRRQILQKMKDDDPKSWLPVWDSIVQAYTRRNLTEPQDKLVALSGLAEQMSRSLKSEHVGYAAGLWEENLTYQLLWSTSGESMRSEIYRGPSWSWASVEGPILPNLTFREMSHFGQSQTLHPISHISELVCMPSGTAQFGEIGFASLSMVGPLLRTNLIRSRAGDLTLRSEPSQRKEPTLSLSIFEDPQSVAVFYDDTQWRKQARNPRSGHDFAMPLGGTHEGDAILDEPQRSNEISKVFFLPIMAYHSMDRLHGTAEDISSIAGLVLESVEGLPGHFRRIGVCRFEENAVVEFLCHLGNQDPSELEYHEAVEEKLSIHEFVFGHWTQLELEFLPKEFTQYQVVIL